jgi:hypothetical protein
VSGGAVSSLVDVTQEQPGVTGLRLDLHRVQIRRLVGGHEALLLRREVERRRLRREPQPRKGRVLDADGTEVAHPTAVELMGLVVDDLLDVRAIDGGEPAAQPFDDLIDLMVFVAGGGGGRVVGHT